MWWAARRIPRSSRTTRSTTRPRTPGGLKRPCRWRRVTAAVRWCRTSYMCLAEAMTSNSWTFPRFQRTCATDDVYFGLDGSLSISPCLVAQYLGRSFRSWRTGFLGAVALFWVRPSGVSRRQAWLGLVLQVIVYASTAAWWAPLMARLVKPDGEMLLRDYQLLMSTHWIRLALITAYGISSFYMLIQSMVRTQWSVS